jgi:hypothetical protein
VLSWRSWHSDVVMWWMFIIKLTASRFCRIGLWVCKWASAGHAVCLCLHRAAGLLVWPVFIVAMWALSRHCLIKQSLLMRQPAAVLLFCVCCVVSASYTAVFVDPTQALPNYAAA